MENLRKLGFPVRILKGKRSLQEVFSACKGTRYESLADAVLETCQAYGEKRIVKGELFTNPQTVFNHFRLRLRDLKQELFIVVVLDNKHQYLTEKMVTQGLLNKSLVHPREVFALAIEHRASALICVHNHPSGDTTPSPEDSQITQRLVDVGKLVGIPVLDHLIIGNDQYYSFVDEGKI